MHLPVELQNDLAVPFLSGTVLSPDDELHLSFGDEPDGKAPLGESGWWKWGELSSGGEGE